MKQYIPYAIIIAVLAMLLLSSMQTCSMHKAIGDVNAAALTDTVKHFENRLGTQTASIKTLQVDKRQLQELVLSKDAALVKLSKEFSRINSLIQYDSNTHFDTIFVPYKDTVPCVFSRTGIIKKDWYSFGYRSDQKGIQVDSFKTWTNTAVITGFKKKWILGRQTAVTDITNSNPHITIAGITAAEVIVPEPWYKKWYIWFSIGFASALLYSQ